ncbi:alpha/beta hydrolase [Nonomuraea aurantiaca]|uniref:alpha/beta hydrolase n=1 Tax=Nonomuraea aurantiaca TaxID=2878562 RepID=UPI001CD9B557|nr:alpha/beta fold hydrolase [Nonomuraea aurantiaca]MCA2222479.1 alpha/beta hydrolase [Nonomuraea aurantiaca]
MSTLEVPGARLYYETHGSGPVMVLITGAPGVADVYRALIPRLATRHTVVVYDRRGFSRSHLDGPQDYDRRLGTDADDARRLIEHLSAGPAIVFGASSGATVALELLARHPSVVRTLIPYEPPALRLLRAGDTWADFFSGVYDLYLREGVEPAMKVFRERTFAPSDHQHMAGAPRNDANAAYWFEHELRQYPPAPVDLAALASYADRVIPAAGRRSQGRPCYEATLELGRRLARDVAELPGGHIGFITDAPAFATELIRTFAHAAP